MALIARHGGGPACVFGSSSGAIVALDLVTRHPDLDALAAVAEKIVSGGFGALEGGGGWMGEVNVAVIAPVLGRDLSFVTGVDPRVRVFDANFAGSSTPRCSRRRNRARC